MMNPLVVCKCCIVLYHILNDPAVPVMKLLSAHVYQLQ